MEWLWLVLFLIVSVAYLFVNWGWNSLSVLRNNLQRWRSGKQTSAERWEEVSEQDRFVHFSSQFRKVETIDLVKDVSYFDVTEVAGGGKVHTDA